MDRRTADRRVSTLIILGLVVVTVLVYARALSADFINLDDNAFVYENADTVRGLTAAGFRHAFTQVELTAWHPLTTLSHQAVAGLFGLKPWAHHLANILFHAAAVAVLFVALQSMTGSTGRAAFVSLVFAIHPLRVEPVVWIAARKDVLMGFFFSLTLLAYSRYAASPGRGRYLVTLLLFTCGLLAKAEMLVVPVLFLLLDYWPLKRLASGRDLPRLIWEKLPFVFLGLVCLSMTWIAQPQHAVVAPIVSLKPLPIGLRFENAIISLVTYLWQTLWPARLAAYYPYPTALFPTWQVVACALVFVAITIFALRVGKTKPYVPVGWFWYFFAVAPLLGIIPLGGHGRADRYTYIAQIGLAIIVAWGAWDILRPTKFGREVGGILAAASGIAMALMSWHHTTYWRNSETLWQHTLAVTEENGTAENNLGCVLLRDGRAAEAVPHLRRALELQAADPLVADNFGEALLESGDANGAAAFYRNSIALESNRPDFHDGLATALLQSGDVESAVHEFREAIRLDPSVAGVHGRLGNALIAANDFDGAIAEYQQVLKLEPANATAVCNIGIAYHRSGRLEEAVTYYRKALAIDPNHSDAKQFLGDAERQLHGSNGLRR